MYVVSWAPSIRFSRTSYSRNFNRTDAEESFLTALGVMLRYSGHVCAFRWRFYKRRNTGKYSCA